MNLRRPPGFATWVLRWFGVDDPLIGDLSEALQGGKSSLWYWRQTLVAIVVTWARNVRALHRYWKAALVGWIAQVGVVWVLSRYRFPPHWYGILLALALWVFQIGARRRLVGDTFEWQDVRDLFPGYETGPWYPSYWGRIPLAVLVACDEFLEYLVLYLILFSFRPISWQSLLAVEIGWLVLHEPVRSLVQPLRRRLKR
jgi:hypothetical protein